MRSYRELTSAAQAPLPASESDHGLKKEMNLRDLVLAQILCVVGSSWVGVAAKLGRAHAVFWLIAISLFYLPLAAVVIYLSRKIPLEGGLYRWAQHGFGDFLGFLTAWNLLVYAIIDVPSILYSLPTDLSYMIGPSASWLPESRAAAGSIIFAAAILISLFAVRGLGAAKWLHNAGSILICSAYALLLSLPLLATFDGQPRPYTPFPMQLPQVSWLNLAIFGQITVGGLSGFEYVAIMAGECRGASRTIARSVWISAPIIALMFILGTSSVLAFVDGAPINLIGPIPQTFSLAFAGSSWGTGLARFGIFLLLARGVAGASLIFTGMTRLPMTAGWDHLLPDWFTRLHPKWKTPVNSILVMTTITAVLLLLSMLGVRAQETMQLLLNASNVHYGLTYVALFALPLLGTAEFRNGMPPWLRVVSLAGLLSSVIAVLIAVYPIIGVSSRLSYASKIAGTVIVSNLLGIAVYQSRKKPEALRAAHT